MNKLFKDAVIVGFALFALFFGAGNIIFPPYIGVVAGSEWLLSFCAYYFADIGLALLAIVAMLRANTVNSVEGIMSRLGHVPSRVLMLAVVFCSAFIAGPRTAAVSFEIGFKPMLGGEGNLLLYTLVYFGICWLCAIRENKLVDIVGRLLTPALVIGLIVMILIGIFNPLGPIAPETKIDDVWYLGIISGYQTLDVTAAVIFGYIAAQYLTNQGYDNPADKYKALGIGTLIVGVLMAVIYGGLCYLGATSSTIYGADIGHGALVVDLFQQLLGYGGAVGLGIVTLLACLTTAIGLVGAPATYMVRMSNGKLNYNVLVTINCVLMVLIANLGLVLILKLAGPLIMTVYPAILVMVCLSLFDAQIKNVNIFRVAVLFSLLFAALEVALDMGAGALSFITSFPLQAHGFGWILPAAAGGLIGYFIKPKAEPLPA